MQFKLQRNVANGLIVGLSMSSISDADTTNPGNADLNDFVADAQEDTGPSVLVDETSKTAVGILGHDPSGCMASDPVGVSFQAGGNLRFTDESGGQESASLFLRGTAGRPPVRYQLRSTNPAEGFPSPSSVSFSNQSCTATSFVVVGVNDGVDDGDQFYEVEVVNANGEVEDTLTVFNFDNDNLPDVRISLVVPDALEIGQRGEFSIRMENSGLNDLLSHRLRVEASQGILLETATCELSDDLPCSQPQIDQGQRFLSIDSIDLPAGQTLQLVVEALGDGAPPTPGPEWQQERPSLRASLSGPQGAPITDNVGVTTLVLKKTGFEDNAEE